MDVLTKSTPLIYIYINVNETCHNIIGTYVTH